MICLSSSATSASALQIDPMKADSIFADPDVIQAIADKRRENPDFLVFQEGFSSSQELATAKKNGTTTAIHMCWWCP